MDFMRQSRERAADNREGRDRVMAKRGMSSYLIEFEFLCFFMLVVTGILCLQRQVKHVQS